MKAFTKTLLQWYSRNHMPYPWRKTKDPYHIWLSEILLQQTRIPVVLRFYQKILKRYPNLKALARANDSAFMALWSGIGYYSRAKNMLACARIVVQKHRGKFPSDLSSLLELPGIGKYTAGAIRNICFDNLTPAIDGNVRRVISRLMTSDLHPESIFLQLGKDAPSSTFFQSMMELGEQICLPKPRCSACPVRKYCKAEKAGKQNVFPKKRFGKRTKTFHWYLLILRMNGSHYYLQNSSRPFLKSAWIFPDVLETREISQAQLISRFHKDWGIEFSGFTERRVVKHTVTFRRIHAHILIAHAFQLNGCKGKWISPPQLDQFPTSSITRKIGTCL